MFGWGISIQDWNNVLYDVASEHRRPLKAYLKHTHYRVVGCKYVVHQASIGRAEGLKGTLTQSQSYRVGTRFIQICRARKRKRKAVVVTLFVLAASGLFVNMFVDLVN